MHFWESSQEKNIEVFTPSHFHQYSKKFGKIIVARENLPVKDFPIRMKKSYWFPISLF